MLSTADGGLRQPMKLPTPSLVFRILDADEIVGYTATIEHNELTALIPGSRIRARAVFIGVPAKEVWVARKFALWHGRDIGTALVQALAAS